MGTVADQHRLSVAVIGTGIAGAAAAWLLSRHHDVTVYERNGWLGGHAHTLDVFADGRMIPVDTGFIVYNERTYPNLTALFSHLGVPTTTSDMSFSASLDGGSFEYSGTSLNGLLGQRRNLVSPRFWGMIAGIRRFYSDAPRHLGDPLPVGLTLGDYLFLNGYGHGFVRDHLLPMGAAIWSATPEQMLAYPASAFITFFASHGLLSIGNRPQWRTVDGGSREYVRRLTAPFADRIRAIGAGRVRRSPNAVAVQDSAGRTEAFDHVVIATHADEALGLLADADPMEAMLLGAWRYTRNRAVLHRDPALMPTRRRVWSSWNFIGGREPGPLCVTYWMNRLQALNSRDDLFVTLNPVREPAAHTVIAEVGYSHPLFDTSALRTQGSLWSLQGQRRTWFCGSYFGHGFHEDALQAGLAVAEQLGGTRRPWSVPMESGRITVLPDANRAVA